MKASNLLVETLFIPSVLAHDDNKNRLILFPGDALRRRPVAVPGGLDNVARNADRNEAHRNKDYADRRFHKPNPR